MSRAAAAGEASLLTPQGRGAIAVIAATGPGAFVAVDAHFRAANGRWISEQPLQRITFGHWFAEVAPDDPAEVAANISRAEELIVCRTGEEDVEIHCHGGIAAADRILAALSAAGCQILPWERWLALTARSPIAAEAAAALPLATTRRTATILLDQHAGALEREVHEIAAGLAQQDHHAEARARLAALCDRADVGLHLTRPWIVAIAGRPNVGKSSLINALVGYQRAIVFDEPGTTRDVLAAETAIDGWPVRLTDSAGLRMAADPLEAAGVALAREQLERADLIVWVLDATELAAAEKSDASIVAASQAALEAGAAVDASRLVVVVNKCDLAAMPAQPVVVSTSALHGTGVSELLATLAARLVPSAPPSGAPVPFTQRQIRCLDAASQACDADDPSRAQALLAVLLHETN